MNIEIEITVAELRSVLPGLARVFSPSSSRPVLQCVRVSRDPAEKGIGLQVQNLDEIATVRLPGRAKGVSGELLVPLEMLTRIIKGCGIDRSVRLISTAEETRIRYPVAGTLVDRLVPHIPPNEWPGVKMIQSEAFPVDEAFKVALRQALECASVDSSRPVLNGACLDVRDKDTHYVVATDGRHLYAANSFQLKLPESLIIPGTKFLAWPDFAADGPWKLRMLPSVKADPKATEPDQNQAQPPWFQIDSEHWSFIARAIDGQFPNWKQVVPAATSGWTQVRLQPSAVERILQAIPLPPGRREDDRAVELTVGNGLVLRAKGPEEEWTHVIVPGVSLAGQSVQTTLNRKYLRRALRFGLRRIEIPDPWGPLLFSAPGRRMVVMPLRNAGPDQPAREQKERPFQTENAPAALPSAPETSNPTEERTSTMSTTPMPERDNLRANHGSSGPKESQDAGSAFKSALERIDGIKAKVRDLIGNLNDAVTTLRTAEKEQRASLKEMQTVRAKLREIKRVEL